MASRRRRTCARLYKPMWFNEAMRFRALMAGKEENYTDERMRQILRDIMPELTKYRFLRKIKPSADDNVGERETIFECLPALWHYQAAQLAQPIGEETRPEEQG